jgi:outer membrane protein OmpA-like peptidoglycan-associated protein
MEHLMEHKKAKAGKMEYQLGRRMTKRLPALTVKAALVAAAVLVADPSAQAAQAISKAPTSTTTTTTSISSGASYSSRARETGDFSMVLDGGVAVPLTRPQSDLFNPGGTGTLKGFFVISDYLDIGPSASFIGLPSASNDDEIGTAWTLGGSVRVKRPYDISRDDAFFGMSPWADADALYVRTGNLNRPGFAVGTGLSVPIGESRSIRVGPFVRYLQIMQARSDRNNADAKIASLGLRVEFGAGDQKGERNTTESLTTTNDSYYCPDRDADGVPDNVDHCPDKNGPMDNWGCPAYKKVVVKRDKLELTEKIQFVWNSDKLEEVSFPLLDDVVQALKDNKNFKVQVEGHSSSEGENDHNQDLSEKRAVAVLDYLEAHGIARSRLDSKGFSSSQPIDTNATSAGRENNRRVEFVVNFIILEKGKK